MEFLSHTGKEGATPRLNGEGCADCGRVYGKAPCEMSGRSKLVALLPENGAGASRNFQT